MLRVGVRFFYFLNGFFVLDFFVIWENIELYRIRINFGEEYVKIICKRMVEDILF